MLIAPIDAITSAPCNQAKLKYGCRDPENKPERRFISLIALFQHGWIGFMTCFQIVFLRWGPSINNGSMLAKLIPSILVRTKIAVHIYDITISFYISQHCWGMQIIKRHIKGWEGEGGSSKSWGFVEFVVKLCTFVLQKKLTYSEPILDSLSEAEDRLLFYCVWVLVVWQMLCGKAIKQVVATKCMCVCSQFEKEGFWQCTNIYVQSLEGIVRRGYGRPADNICSMWRAHTYHNSIDISEYLRISTDNLHALCILVVR